MRTEVLSFAILLKLVSIFIKAKFIKIILLQIETKKFKENKERIRKILLR